MAYKPLWNWMDKQEGRKKGSSTKAMKKYKGMTAYEVGATQGHSKAKVDSMISTAKKEGKKMEMAKKMGRKEYEKIKRNTAKQGYKAGYGHNEHDEM